MSTRFNEPNYVARVSVWTPGFRERLTGYDVEQVAPPNKHGFTRVTESLVVHIESLADSTGLAYILDAPLRPGRHWSHPDSPTIRVSR